jgi:hypothetical protein
MHDVGSSVPFTESSSHNSVWIPIFLDQLVHAHGP